MKTYRFEAAPLGAENVDTVNGIIRGVSMITGNVVATGHDLTVDGITLAQMQRCSEAKGRVSVKIDHRSGAASVCGWLENFRQEDSKLKADLHLLENHPQRGQLLEIALRMPSGLGLSASFVSPENAEPGKARCSELISCDLVPTPAANPDGLFSAKVDRRPAIRRIGDAVADNVDVTIPGADEASTALKYAQHPLARRIGARLLKVAAGAGTGHAIGKRYGQNAGAVTGAAAGLFFSVPEHISNMNTESTVKRLNQSIERHRRGPKNGLESHTLESLSRRTYIPPKVISQLIANGTLKNFGAVHSNGCTNLHSFSSAELDLLQQRALGDVVDQVIQNGTGNPDEIPITADHALGEHVKQFEAKPKNTKNFSGHWVDDDEPDPLATAAKVAGVGAAAYGGLSYLRGRKLAPNASALGKFRAGSAANIATGKVVAGSLSEGARKVAAVLAGKRFRPL